MKEAEVETLLNPVVIDMGYELWACEYLAQGKHSLLRIYIDSEEGIQIADCEKVSKQVSAVLDVETLITDHYTLEVSSPGFDRPLVKLAHFQRFIGNEVTVKLRTPLEGKKKVRGIIKKVSDDVVTLIVNDKAIAFSFANFVKANLAS